MPSPPISEQVASLFQSLAEGRRLSHSAIVLRAAEILNAELLRAIETRAKPFNASAAKRLLGENLNYKILDTRIKAAKALDILDTEAYRILILVKEIRNEFGHPNSFVSLETEPVLSLFTKLHTNPKIGGNYGQVFFAYVSYANDVLEKYLVSVGITNDITEANLPKI